MKVFLTRLDGHSSDPDEGAVVPQRVKARGHEIILPPSRGQMFEDPIKKADIIISQILLDLGDTFQLTSVYAHIAEVNRKPTLLLVPDAIFLAGRELTRMPNEWLRCEPYGDNKSLLYVVDKFLDDCIVRLREGVIVQEEMFALQASKERK